MNSKIKINRTHAYICVSHETDLSFETEKGPRTFKLFLYGGYQVNNQVSYKRNGIGILDLDFKRVVLDWHCPEQNGSIGPSRTQIVEFKRISRFNWDSFQIFANAHDNKRSEI